MRIKIIHRSWREARSKPNPIFLHLYETTGWPTHFATPGALKEDPRQTDGSCRFHKTCSLSEVCSFHRSAPHVILSPSKSRNSYSLAKTYMSLTEKELGGGFWMALAKGTCLQHQMPLSSLAWFQRFGLGLMRLPWLQRGSKPPTTSREGVGKPWVLQRAAEVGPARASLMRHLPPHFRRPAPPPALLILALSFQVEELKRLPCFPFCRNLTVKTLCTSDR